MNKHILLLQLLLTASVFAQSPVITLTGDSVIEIYMGSTFVDPGATAYDEEDGDISNSIQVSGSVDTNTHGTYVLAYNVTDSDGNSATVVVRTINVVDDARPSHELTINASLSGDDDVPEIGDTITYEIILSNTGNTDFSEYGFYNEWYYVTDFNGNSRPLTTPPTFVSSSYSDSGYSIPGEQHIYRATYQVTQQALDSGGLTLQLSAVGYSSSGNAYSSMAVNEFVFGTSSDEIILDGQISANNNQIKKVADPTDNLDAVNKRYVDQRTLEQTISGQNIGDLLYWNGQSWQKLSAPQEQSTVRFCEGQLTWGPCKPQIKIFEHQFFDLTTIEITHQITTNNSNWSEVGYFLSSTDTTPDSDDIFLGDVHYYYNTSDFETFNYNFAPDTDYYIRAYISGDFGINYSDTVVVTTPSQDQNGNAIFSKTFGNQEWSTKNAEVTTYRDGTPIPEVTDPGEWANLTTGAWCYSEYGDRKLYNWYAVAGINDNDPNTPTKEFAPEGWHVPTYAEWSTLENYLIDNGYNYDGTTTGNKIAKSMATSWGWSNDDSLGAVGNNQSLNNRSGFNAYPLGYRYWDSFFNKGNQALFWSSTSYNGVLAWYFRLSFNLEFSELTPDDSIWKQGGMQVRFVKD